MHWNIDPMQHPALVVGFFLKSGAKGVFSVMIL
jgi:hypothetical protein